MTEGTYCRGEGGVGLRGAMNSPPSKAGRLGFCLPAAPPDASQRKQLSTVSPAEQIFRVGGPVPGRLVLKLFTTTNLERIRTSS